MTRQQILEEATTYLESNGGNRVSADKALRPELIGMKIYDPPIIGIASAQDDYLLSLQAAPSAGVPQPPPTFWLESAKSVISLFFPFTAKVRESNFKAALDEPSQEMLHARNEGHAFIFQLCEHLKELLENMGYAAVIPARDSRHWMAFENPSQDGRTFTSNWSERHVAFACGVGTFSLHDGIITEVGAAGRLASLVTDLELPPTTRPYRELYEYCTKCGACISNCPAHAITLEEGRSNLLCRDFLKGVEAAYKDRKYIGCCGKCQINVPCEVGIPGK